MEFYMKKSWIIALFIIILLGIGSIVGIYAYQRQATKDSNSSQNRQLATQEEEYINHEIAENIVSTSSVEEKISPNCTIIEKQYFTGCDHIIRTIKDVPEEYINATKEKFAKGYKDWKIENFTTNQINIYQEKEGFCGQHYLIKEHNGVIAIYLVDEEGKENWKEDTEIQIMYLPEQDIEQIRQGIMVIGNTELYSILEDFE